ncbi:MAG: hypothetical protein IJC26_07760 [Clostridia bacterium]|nr:hypothetical protein [Clostridia bacterium]
MRIGIFETLPILREKLRSERILYPYGGKIVAENVRKGSRYDLILSDKDYFPPSISGLADVFLVPDTASVRSLPERGILLTGGMSQSDSVSFSSIGENEAMLWVQQEICLNGKSILPFEKKVRFDRNFSLYKNLATGFALSLAQILFTEEL